jgi:hypothetical protein
MNLKETVKESLLKIATLMFNGNMSEMSREVGIPRAQLQTYGIRSVPSAEVLRKYIDFGISSDYLLTGKGSMFADNKAGQELKLKYDKQYENGQYKIVSVEYLNNLTELMRKIK